MQWRRALVSGPHDSNWWIAWAFMVGSMLFALGSVPVFSQHVDPTVVGVTFVIGALCFTSAASGQYLQVVGSRTHDGIVRRSYFRPGRRDWWATTIQLVGTLFFIADTVDATIVGLTTRQTNRLVWAPDVFGSTAFLVASHLAWVGVCGGIWSVMPDRSDWWTAAVNYVGSIFFGVSAIGALVLPTTGEMVNTALVNSATFAGALCFLVGAYLLLPAGRRADISPGSRQGRS